MDDICCVRAAAFKYSPSHDVAEVSKADYDACSGANPIKSYTGGATTVKLTTPGKRYFICSVTGHCSAGMKLEVTVAAAAVTAPAPSSSAGRGSKPRHRRSVAPTPAPAPAPEPSSTEELPNVATPTAAPAPKSSGAATVGGKKAVVGLAAVGVVAMALAM
jgi:hypothetical protein